MPFSPFWRKVKIEEKKRLGGTYMTFWCVLESSLKQFLELAPFYQVSLRELEVQLSGIALA